MLHLTLPPWRKVRRYLNNISDWLDDNIFIDRPISKRELLTRQQREIEDVATAISNTIKQSNKLVDLYNCMDEIGHFRHLYCKPPHTVMVKSWADSMHMECWSKQFELINNL